MDYDDDGIGGGELRQNSRVEPLILEEVNNQPDCAGVVFENWAVLQAMHGAVSFANNVGPKCSNR